MKRKRILSRVFVWFFSVVSFRGRAEESKNSPVAVSPGSDTAVVSVWQSCPTFSWSAVDQASSYRVVVFEAADSQITAYEDISAISSPLIIKDIPGPALSWTLPAEERLKTGSMYSWYVQAVNADGNALGNWSNGNIFKVEQEVLFAGVEEKLAEKMRAYGVNEETISNVLKDIKSEVQEVEVRKPATDSGISNNSGMSRVQGTEGDSTYYGLFAGSHNTTGYWNTFVGNGAGEANTTGYQNAFFGGAAGGYNIDGYANTFIGMYAGVLNTSGNTNTFLGFSAGFKNTGGNGNSFIGANAGYSNLSGCKNIFIGQKAGYSTTFANENIFIGEMAGYSNTTTNGNIFIGEQAGYSITSGIDNIFIGNPAGYKNTGGNSNIFFGDFCGFNNTTGNYNTFLGNNAGYSTNIGSWNTYIGNGAGYINGMGYKNVFLGNGAGYLNNGVQNVFLGFQAGYNETGSNKLYIANSNTNSPLIYGEFDNGIININGKLGIGTKTPTYIVDVSRTGTAANFACTQTDGASAIIAAGSSHVFIGAKSNHDFRLIANDSPKITILPSGNVGVGTNTPSYPLHMASGAYCSTGGTWTNASSRSLKENIHDLTTDEAVDTLLKLNPVKYNYKVDTTDKHVGFIAEDVPELMATADRKGLSPMDVTAVLTKVVQEQQKIIENLQERLTKLEQGS